MDSLLLDALIFGFVYLVFDDLALRLERRQLRAALRRAGSDLIGAGLVQERAEAVLAARLAAAWRAQPLEDGDAPPILVEPLESRLN